MVLSVVLSIKEYISPDYTICTGVVFSKVQGIRPELPVLVTLQLKPSLSGFQLHKKARLCSNIIQCGIYVQTIHRPSPVGCK